MKFLIAGLGSIGRRHLRNLKALGHTDMLLYRTHQATLPDTDLSGFPTFTDLQQALAEKPNGVIVANPTALHLEVATASAKAGAALLIEKPVSDSLLGIRELQTALDEAGKPVPMFEAYFDAIHTLATEGAKVGQLTAAAGSGRDDAAGDAAAEVFGLDIGL